MLPLFQYFLRHQSKAAAYWHPTFWYFTRSLQHFSSDPIDGRRRPVFSRYLVSTLGPLSVLSPCSGQGWAGSLEPASSWCPDPVSPPSSVCLRLAAAQGCCPAPDSWQEIPGWPHPVRALSLAQPMLPKHLYVTRFLSVFPQYLRLSLSSSSVCLSLSHHATARGGAPSLLLAILLMPGHPAACSRLVQHKQSLTWDGWEEFLFPVCLMNMKKMYKWYSHACVILF